MLLHNSCSCTCVKLVIAVVLLGLPDLPVQKCNNSKSVKKGGSNGPKMQYLHLRTTRNFLSHCNKWKYMWFFSSFLGGRLPKAMGPSTAHAWVP